MSERRRAAAAAAASASPAAGARSGATPTRQATPLLPPRPRNGRPGWALAVDGAVVFALLVVAVLGFGPAFGGAGYLVAGLGGGLLGILIAVAGWRLRWNIVIVAAVTIVAYLLFGGALAVPQTTLFGVIPTLETVRQLVLGIVFSWKDVLTLVTPVGAFPAVLVVPYLSSLVATVLATSFALRLRPSRAAWALLPLLALFVTAIAFGTREAAFPVLQGLLFAGIALVWAAWRRAEARTLAAVGTTVDGGSGAAGAAGAGGAGGAAGLAASAADPEAAKKLRNTRLALGAGLVVASLGLGFVVGGVLVPAAAREVIRDQIVPPLDLHDYASPLVGYRTFVRDFKEQSLFEVSGLPDDARIRLATLDAYDGIVYNVAGDGTSGSGSFVRVSDDIANDTAGEPATLEFTMTGLDGVWLPDAGYLDSFEFTGDRAGTLKDTLHYNAATGVALNTTGITEGDTYTVGTVVPERLNDEQLADRSVSDIQVPRATGVPDDVSALANEYLGDAETPIEQVRNLASGLSQNGFFSHGLEGEAVSRAGHGAERIASMLGAEQMIGDDEQYAVAMALMVRSIGLPARVVMGFYPDDYTGADSTYAITGDQLHAWVEVPFDGAGWVAFDPTPPEDQIPLEEAPKPKSDPKAQVLQPPPPPQEPAELPPDIRTQDTDQDELEEEGVDLAPVFLIGGGILLLLVLIFGPLLTIVLLKLRRRNKRRRAARAADRVSGGWDEIVDRAGDLGTPVPAGATRRSTAATLATAYPEAPMVAVATRADSSVFGPGDPSEQEVDQYWTEVDVVVKNMAKSRSAWKRFAAAWSVRSFFRRPRRGGRR